MTKYIVLVVALLVGGCESEAPEPAMDVDAGAGGSSDCGAAAQADAMAAADACVHVEAPLGPGPFTGCTCGDVLRISPTNPDLAECVLP